MSKSGLIILLTGLSCCSFWVKEKPGSIDDFKAWYRTNYQALVSSSDYDEINYQVRYNPAELRLLGMLDRKEIKDKSGIKKWYKENDTYDEFSFKITSKTGKDLFVEYSETKEEINDKQFYFVESAKYDFLLVREKDTIMPLHYQFENNYGMAPFVTMYLVFDKAEKDNPVKELIFKDQMFNKIIVPFKINQLNNLNVPKITQL